MSGMFGWMKKKEHKHDKTDKHNTKAGSSQKHVKHEKKGKKGLDKQIEEDELTLRVLMEKEDMLWFHGDINRRRAEMKLKSGGNMNGLFLIRESNLAQGDFVLSFVHTTGSYGHYMIEQKADFRYSLRNEEPIEGLDELIKYYIHQKHSLPFTLSQPLPGEPPPALCLKAGHTNILHRAIEKGDAGLALKILEHEFCPDVNSRNDNGSSTLHLAVEKGLVEVVQKLIDESVCLSMCDRDGFTPLHRACQYNKADMVELLLSAGADTQYRHRRTENVALHEAAALGHVECVKSLLAHGAAAWTRNANQQTPYELAAKFDHRECGKLFDEYKPPPAISVKRDWFHEKLTRQDAVKVMEKHQFSDGYFLVRRSSRNPTNYVLTLSFNGSCRHYEIIKEGSIAFHIDNGPLLSSLPHVIDYYIKHADGLDCLLTTAVTPGGELKMVNVTEDDMANYENSQVIYGVHENGGNLYMEGKDVMRRASLPAEPPPPPPPAPNTHPLFPGKGKHPLKLDPESIELGFELGQGEYGSVLRGVWTSKDGVRVDVAIKTMNEEGMDTESSKKQFLQEAEVMVKLDHPCIVALIGVSEGPPLMLVQELVSLGSLLDFLLDYPEKIDASKDLLLWATQVACGMLYLESQGYVHRDLATRNILLAGKQQAKVGDFGLSRATEGANNVYRASKGGRWPVKWYAPESINYGQFSHASDVWSFGVTLWEMYTFGDQPYGEMKGAQVIAYLEAGNRLERPPKAPLVIYDIMRDCWSMDSEQRPTFRWLYTHFNRRIETGSFRLASQGHLYEMSNV